MEFLRSIHRQFPHLGLAEARLIHEGERPDSDVRSEAGKRRAPDAPDVPDAPEPSADTPERAEADVRKEAKDRNARTEGTKEEQMEAVKRDLGNRIARLRGMPNSDELVKQELQSFNRNVAHKHGFHASITNGRLDFGEYRPEQKKAPSELDKKISQTERRLARVEWEIHYLLGRGKNRGRGFSRTGAEYRAYKGASMSRYNRTPEVTGMLAGLSAQELQAYGPKLGELAKERVKLNEELAHLLGLKKAGLPLDESTDTTTTTSSDGQSIDFQASEGPTTKFDLEQSLKNMDPATAEAVRKLPTAMQEAAARTLEGMSEAELNEARTLLAGIAAMDSDTLRSFLMGPFFTKEGKINIPDKSPDEEGMTAVSGEAKAMEFIRGLSPAAKAVLEKIMGTILGVRNSVTVTTKEASDVADKATIARLVKLRREAKTETDIDVAEGLLMMQGVDLDKSDIDGGKIVMADKDVRPFLYLFGFIRFIKGVIDKAFGKKGAKGDKDGEIKAPEGKDGGPPKKPGDMTPEEKNDEKNTLTSTLEKAKAKEKTLADEIAALEKDLANPDTKPEAKPKIEEQIAQKKRDLEALRKVREAVEARLRELEGGGAGPETRDSATSEIDGIKNRKSKGESLLKSGFGASESPDKSTLSVSNKGKIVQFRFGEGAWEYSTDGATWKGTDKPIAESDVGGKDQQTYFEGLRAKMDGINHDDADKLKEAETVEKSQNAGGDHLTKIRGAQQDPTTKIFTMSDPRDASVALQFKFEQGKWQYNIGGSWEPTTTELKKDSVPNDQVRARFENTIKEMQKFNEGDSTVIAAAEKINVTVDRQRTVLKEKHGAVEKGAWNYEMKVGGKTMNVIWYAGEESWQYNIDGGTDRTLAVEVNDADVGGNADAKKAFNNALSDVRGLQSGDTTVEKNADALSSRKESGRNLLLEDHGGRVDGKDIVIGGGAETMRWKVESGTWKYSTDGSATWNAASKPLDPAFAAGHQEKFEAARKDMALVNGDVGDAIDRGKNAPIKRKESEDFLWSREGKLKPGTNVYSFEKAGVEYLQASYRQGKLQYSVDNGTTWKDTSVPVTEADFGGDKDKFESAKKILSQMGEVNGGNEALRNSAKNLDKQKDTLVLKYGAKKVPGMYQFDMKMGGKNFEIRLHASPDGATVSYKWDGGPLKDAREPITDEQAGNDKALGAKLNGILKELQAVK